MKKLLVVSWLILIFCGIGYLFWYHEWKYSLPTPVPKNYKTVNTGEHIDITGKVVAANNKPVFIHFFNPDCPCSKFNIPHFNSLVKKYGNAISFSVVVIHTGKEYSAEEIQQRFDIHAPVSFDSTIASACGVYSTPQAVLLDAGHQLYYRGNYNKSRYCTDNNSNFAQMAIDSLLNNDVNPVFSQYALKAYGCTISTCSK